MTRDDTTANAIVREIRDRAPFDPHASGGRRDIHQGYLLQDAVAAGLVDAGVRGPVAGYKIAVNAPALMAHFGVEEPASGRVFADQCHDSGAGLPADGFADFAYEPEIAAVMGAPLRAGEAPFSRAAVAACIDRMVPALELLDLRGSNPPDQDLADVIAQNISNAGAVIGGPGIAPDALDPAQVHTSVTIDAAPELSVTGAAPQHPLDAAHWLANHLARRGLSLAAGQIILCGTHAPIRPVRGPARIDVAMSDLGTVSVALK